jgi:DNA-binding SARP family transcriptional activator
VRLTYFGGPAWDAGPLPARGRGQESLLFRLAVDAGAAVSVRALADDLWPVDAPDDPRAAVQSLVSRLRRALGSATIEAVSGGYRLTLGREEIDLTRFQDLVAAARREDDPERARLRWRATRSISGRRTPGCRTTSTGRGAICSKTGRTPSVSPAVTTRRSGRAPWVASAFRRR